MASRYLSGLALLAALSCASLSACAQSTPTPSAETQAEEDDDSAEKYNAYVKAFNALNSMFYGSTKGMPDLLAKYKSQSIGGISLFGRKEPILYLNISMLRNSVGALQEGTAIASSPSHYAKLEAAAKHMLANAAPLYKMGTTFESYVRSKKYLEDDYALAKAQDAEYVSRWEQLIQDHGALGEELSVIERQDRIETVKRYRARGNHLNGATAEAMLHASDLLNVFDEASDFRDAYKVKAGDQLAAKLEQATEEIKLESEKTGINASRTQFRIFEVMNQFLGSYRELKRSCSDRAFESLVEHYNRAVRDFGRIR